MQTRVPTTVRIILWVLLRNFHEHAGLGRTLLESMILTWYPHAESRPNSRP